MMKMELTVGAIAIGAGAATLFWAQPMAVELKAFGLAVLLGTAMAIVRLSFGYGDGNFDALIHPPSWKLLAIVSAAAGLGASVLASLLKTRERSKRK